MSDSPAHLPRSEREARRAVLHDALVDMAGSADPDAAATDVLRALDAYIDSHSPAVAAPREPPVTDFDRREARELRVGVWLVIGTAVVVTTLVAVLLSGGWPAGLAIAAIWLVALFVLATT